MFMIDKVATHGAGRVSRRAARVEWGLAQPPAVPLVSPGRKNSMTMSVERYAVANHDYAVI